MSNAQQRLWRTQVRHTAHTHNPHFLAFAFLERETEHGQCVQCVCDAVTVSAAWIENRLVVQYTHKCIFDQAIRRRRQNDKGQPTELYEHRQICQPPGPINMLQHFLRSLSLSFHEHKNLSSTHTYTTLHTHRDRPHKTQHNIIQ